MPTIKQKKAFKKTMENNGNVSKAMRETGYSKNTAKNPKTLTDSDGWQELMEEYFPDEDLAKKHKELLNKQETFAKNNNKTGKIDIVKTGEIDAHAVGKGLEMAYKLKGKYAAEKIKIIDNHGELTDEEIEEEINKRNSNGKS